MVEESDSSFVIEEATGDDIEDCERILRALPEWFGIEESIVEYVSEMRRMHTFVARVEGEVHGFLALKPHNDSTSEIYVMAVDSRLHRQGIGRALVAEAEKMAQGEGRRLLEVKTLGPSHPDSYYARTRSFYTSLGFMPLEEIHGLWPGNPCLIMVKVLDEGSPA